MILRPIEGLIVQKSTIRGSLMGLLAFVIIVLTALSCAVFCADTLLARREMSTVDQQATFNSYYNSLWQADKSLENFLISADERYATEFRNASREAEGSAQSLVEYFGRREFVDAEHMLESYLEAAEPAFAQKRNKETGAYAETYEAAHTVRLRIDDRYTTLYAPVARAIAEERRAIERQYLPRLLVIGGLIALVSAICFVTAREVSEAIVNPLRRLAEAAERVNLGDLGFASVPAASDNEISSLALAFNRMLGKLQEQIAELEEKHSLEARLKDEEMKNLAAQNLLKEGRMRLLQARINPHFLFNSLNMIAQTAYIENAKRTVDMIVPLTDLLRYNLRDFDRGTIVTDEIANVEDYFYIQRRRFENRIEFSARFDGAIGKAKLPHLVLQPLVENSIIHGVESYSSGGIVGVEATDASGRLLIRAFDNGCGIDPATKERIRDAMQSSGTPLHDTDVEEHIGLQNVFTRLKLFFDGDMHVEISSEPRRLTEIRIWLPIML